MSRLPRPGEDANIWGDILNDFLAVAHLGDGNLKPGVVSSTQIADASITPAKLSQAYAHASEKGIANGLATLDGSGTVPVSQLPAGSVVSDATATSKGIVQLAGDLGGTAVSPTVPGLAAKAADSAVVHNTGTETVAGVKTFSSSPVVPTPASGTDAANKNYVDSTVASSSAPDATTSSKGIIQLAGDLAGTAAAPTVPGLANKANSSTTISAGTGLTGGGDLSANRTLAVTYGTTSGTAAQGNDSRITGAEQTSNKGAANGYASLDGSGLIPTSQLPATADATTSSKGIIQLAGDLAGTATAPTVPGLANKVNTSAVGAANGVASLDSNSKLTATQLPLIYKTHTFSSTGPLITENGTHRLYNDSGAAWTITGVRASAGVAPTGSSVIVDVNVNGTTIFSTQANRPTIAIGANTSGKVTNMNTTTIANGEYVTVDVDQVGSTISGSDLTVQLEVA